MIRSTARVLQVLFCVAALSSVVSCSKASRERDISVNSPSQEAKSSEASASKLDTATQSRAMVQEADVTLRTRSPGDVVARLTKFVEAQGGYVVSSDVTATTFGTIGARLSFRIPSSKLVAILMQLRTFGDVRNEQRHGDDVTTEVLDTEARLTARRVFEKRLLELLATARTVDDMLKVEAELSRVRTDIERLVGQSRKLSQSTEMALVNVTVEAPELTRAAVESFASRLAEAFRSAFATSQSILLGLVEVLGVIIPLVVIGLLGWLPVRIARQRFAIRRKARFSRECAADERPA